jgi:hypothetical protein
MTDRGMAFPEIGQIRKGAPKTENRPGSDLDYFRVEFDEREEEARKKFVAVFGDKPKEITIWLPYNEIERCWDANLEAYTASQMVAKADGEKFLYLRDVETGEILVRDGIDVATGGPRPYVDGEPVGYYTDSKGNKKSIFCEPVGRLKVIIPALERFAYLTVHTTSYYDIVNISSNLEALEFINQGQLQGIDIVMSRRKKKVSTPDPKKKGKRVRREKSLIWLEAAPEWVQEQINGRSKRAGLQLPETVGGEEVVDGEYSEAPIVEGDVIKWSSKQLGWVVPKFAKDSEHAKAMLDRSELPMEAEKDVIERWSKVYRGHRDSGKSAGEAAGIANEGYRKWKENQPS